ncbi:TadE/TadG family type IV pilus assembly protein [Actinoplanes regularis]|uniref:TadE-like protein n=1 Tax=Actinoplanes regularis TaxID=52697 RepID=A0A239EY67_9ACTN|nr:TadE/TadG family type IV pilus assembly protein [Actinoplanes regularis]GIE89731.1 membrane protein [Actinoplanes regularis]SNS49391.1 TadE-like protein [Actinoplanes regularis]
MTSRASRRQRDRGAASVELLLALPLLGLLLMAAVQFALWQHASHMAQAAANEGMQIARAYNSSAAAGRSDTEALLRDLSGGALSGTTVSASRSATAATITITGHAPAVIPGLTFPIRVTVTAPVERIPPS